MTVGIVVVIPGGAVAIADGRTTFITTNEVTSDRTLKIQSAHGQTVVVFGVSQVTDRALELLRERARAAAKCHLVFEVSAGQPSICVV